MDEQAEEARIKSEAEKGAAAKATFEATFKALENSKSADDNNDDSAPADDSDTNDGDDDARRSDLPARPAGPVNPSKCLATGAGIVGAPSTFMVVAKDSEGRKISSGEKLLLRCSCYGQLLHPACLMPPWIDVIPADWSCYSCKVKTVEYLQARDAYVAELLKS